MAGERPEITFGSNVAVWRNKQGRSVTIKPRQYQDKEGQWQSATGWNVSDLAHLAHCLILALNHCLAERAAEQRLPLDRSPEPAPPPTYDMPPGDGTGPF